MATFTWILWNFCLWKCASCVIKILFHPTFPVLWRATRMCRSSIVYACSVRNTHAQLCGVYSKSPKFWSFTQVLLSKVVENLCFRRVVSNFESVKVTLRLYTVKISWKYSLERNRGYFGRQYSGEGWRRWLRNILALQMVSERLKLLPFHKLGTAESDIWKTWKGIISQPWTTKTWIPLAALWR